MSEYAEPIDVSTSAELQRLAEQVQETSQPVRLTRGDTVLAVVHPVLARKPARRPNPMPLTSPKDSTLESLAGAAGSLPEPRPWKDVLQTAREDHLAKKFPLRHE